MAREPAVVIGQRSLGAKGACLRKPGGPRRASEGEMSGAGGGVPQCQARKRGWWSTYPAWAV
eukprot:3664230-Pyramimonas_sp.AAC.1